MLVSLLEMRIILPPLLALAFALPIGCAKLDGGTSSLAGGDASSGDSYTLRLKAQKTPIEYDIQVQVSADMSKVSGVSPAVASGQNTAAIEGVQVVEWTAAEGGNIASKTHAKKVEVVDATGILKDQAQGIAQSILAGSKQVSVMTSLGEKVSGNGAPFSLPEQPVKVGDTWQIKQEDGAGTGKIVGVDRSKGHDLVQLEISGVAPPSGGRLVGPVQVVFDPKAGVYDSLSVDTETTLPNGTKMSFQLNAKRRS